MTEQTDNNGTHWHIAPLSADGYAGFMTATEIAGLGCLDDQISEELSRAATDAYEMVGTHAEQSKICREDGNNVGELDYLRDMLREYERAEDLALKAQAFQYTNANAPLYVDNPSGWTDRVLVMIEQTFPINITPNEGLNVWQCPVGATCDHLIDSEDGEE